MRCLIDTGCSWCMIDKELENKSVQELCYDPKNHVEYSFFKIGEADFGPILFRPLPNHCLFTQFL